MKKLSAIVVAVLMLIAIVNNVSARETPAEPVDPDIELSATDLPDVLKIEEKKVELGENALISVDLPVAIKHAYVSKGVLRIVSVAMPWAPKTAVAYLWRVSQADGKFKPLAAFSKDKIVETGESFYIELLEVRNGEATSVRMSIMKNRAVLDSKTFTKP